MTRNNGEPRLYLKGINTNLRPNDPLLIDYGAAQPAALPRRRGLPDATADHTLVKLRPWVAAELTPDVAVRRQAFEAELAPCSARFQGAEAESTGVSADTQMYKETVERLAAAQACLSTAPSLDEAIVTARNDCCRC